MQCITAIGRIYNVIRQVAIATRGDVVRLKAVVRPTHRSTHVAIENKREGVAPPRTVGIETGVGGLPIAIENKERRVVLIASASKTREGRGLPLLMPLPSKTRKRGLPFLMPSVSKARDRRRGHLVSWAPKTREGVASLPREKERSTSSCHQRGVAPCAVGSKTSIEEAKYNHTMTKMEVKSKSCQ